MRVGFYKGKDIYNLTFYNRFGEKIDYNQPIGSAEGHGGGDIRLLDMIIRGGLEDPLGPGGRLQSRRYVYYDRHCCQPLHGGGQADSDC